VDRHTGGHLPARRAAPQNEFGYAEPEAGYRRPRTPVDDLMTSGPADPPPRHRHREPRPPSELTETPNDLPRTRRPAREITDEEFWTHMRGDAPR
jgi:hypothetical protein